ncbi:phage holin family protein [Brevibacillus humidisoli]|uniref:phage holin family protein n=1 Tax=Brevibacillus humidisoli TaxID=2895522 RepID=UPI001E5B5C28|nr:phage holin family protein [Brevibacillus humidisoli]UFJ39998.1 phage holin family protein [Brevibacillus humidisoli]
MLRWVVRLLLNGGALLAISYLFDEVEVTGFGVAVMAAFILGLVNTMIRPILVMLTMPLNFLTLGLFWFFTNAVTFALTAYLIDGFEIGVWPDSLMTTVLAAATMSLFAAVIHRMTRKKKAAS